MKELVLARGLDPNFVARRLAHSSSVSALYRYIYVGTPKAACTALKHFIVTLEKARCDFARKPYLRETRMSMLIHQRMFISMPSLLSLSPQDVKGLASGNSGFEIFGLVHNPFSRVVSSFESKVRLCEPGFRKYKQWSASEVGVDVRVTFSDFLRENLDFLGCPRGEQNFLPLRSSDAESVDL